MTPEVSEDLIFWLALNSLPSVGPVTLKKLILEYSSPKELYKAITENSGTDITDTIKKIRKKLKHIPSLKEFYNLAQKIDNLKHNYTCYLDEYYPKNLEEIHDPPMILFYLGSLVSSDRKAVAIIGSRHPSHYGIRVTEKLTKDLVAMNVTIISGLARGIDTIAHKTAVSAGGRTIAVLGCGLDIFYPPEHKKMYREIAKSGAVISEFLPGTRPDPRNFPKRNRIISGLSLGVVVIEASLKSGSLITAKEAIDQGREVFAVPGSIYSFKSTGTHKLIKEGAKLVEKVQDIIDELPPWMFEKSLPGKKEVKTKKIHLSNEETIVYKFISPYPIHIDDIIRRSGMSPPMVTSIITKLELKGLIKELPGKMFVKK